MKDGEEYEISDISCQLTLGILSLKNSVSFKRDCKAYSTDCGSHKQNNHIKSKWRIASQQRGVNKVNTRMTEF